MNTPRTEMDGMGEALGDVMALADKATTDWRPDRFGVIRAGIFRRYPNGEAQSQIASFTSDTDDAESQRDLDRDFALSAINFIRQHGPTIAAMVADGERYRWLRTKEVDIYAATPAMKMRSDRLDEEIDRWMRIDAARAGGGHEN